MTLAVDNASVIELLVDSAADRGNAPALIDHRGRVVLTFEDLLGQVPRLAAQLIAAGVEPGHRVLALSIRPRDFVLLTAAVLWAGGTLVVPPRLRGWRSVLRAASAAKPHAIVADSLLWPLIATERRLRSAAVRICIGPLPLPGIKRLARARGSQPVRPVQRGPDDPALISFTSGTTGAAKLVVRTHGVLAAQHRALGSLRAFTRDDLDLAGLPLLILHDVAAGVSCVLPPPGRASEPRFAAALRATLQLLQVTSVAGFPSLFDGLSKVAEPGDLPALRSVYIGGAMVRPALLESMAALAPSARQVVVYGSTEAEPIAAIDSRAYLRSWECTRQGYGICVGQPVGETDVRLAPVCGATSQLGGEAGRRESEFGRVMVRGPQVTAPSAGPWLDTGDLGRFDSDGCLWLMGRTTNFVAGGPLPAEVEPVVESLPWVRAAALVAVPTADGNRAVLAVEPRPEARGRGLALRCELEVLAKEKGWGLAGIVLTRKLPRDARSGSKIDYPRLIPHVSR